MDSDLDFDAGIEEGGVADVEQAPGPLGPNEGWWGGEVVPLHDDPAFTHFEYGPSMTLVDSDHSGFWNRAVIDVDGDGAPNVVASVQGAGVIVMVDVHGDGQFESTEFLTHDELAELEPELADLLAPQMTYVPAEDATYLPIEVDYEATISESPFWFQQAANGLCVPASIAQIVAEYTGVAFESEAEFVELANEYGLFWVGPDGVPSISAEGALFLLEQAGVPASMIVSANLDMLDTYIDDGHGVVLAVDSSEIWYGESGSGGADHALVITDIDRDAGVAVLSDPGHPDGNGFTLPLEVLEQAWAAGGNTMIVAEQPADSGSSEAGSVVEVAAGLAGGEGAATVVGGQDGGIVVPGLELPEPGLPGGGLPGGVEAAQLHSTVAGAAAFVARMPWVLLPVAVAAGRLLPR